MVNTITSLFRKAFRVLKEKGLKGLFQKTKRKIKLILITLQKLPDVTADSRVTAKEAQSLQEKTADWLRGNRKNFNNQFYVLLNYLLSFNKQLKSISPVACEDYKNHFKQNCYIGNLPFEITFPDVKGKENIIEFINDFDRIYLDRMICSVFIRLIRFMVKQKEEINLLDFGAGSLCGMFGENGRFLFEAGNVNIDSVNFYAIDDMHKPQGSIFKKATYKKCNILSFDVDKQFDIITGHHVMEHCFNWDDVIRHVAKLLRHEGYLYLSFPRLGGFYDTSYRSMSRYDHCADFDLDTLKTFSESVGLEMCLSDIYVDPNNRFDWICNLYPELVSKEIADCFYDLSVVVDSKLILGYHHYGHYVVFKKIKNV